VPLRLRVIPRAGQKAGDGQGPTAERVVEFEDHVDTIRIGRRSDLELSLPFKALSGLHARLVHKRAGNAGGGNVWLIEDLDSKNGTFVGKSRLKAGEQRLLFAGDTLDLGQVQLVFDGHSTGTAGAEGTATIARRLVNDLFLASPEVHAPTLTVISGAPNVETLKLVERERPYLIGRGQDCDLRFELDELSRHHASFTRTWNGTIVKDLGSKNGIHVNDVTVTSQRISDGDLIDMGPLKLRLMDPEDKYLRDLDNNPDRPPPGEARPKPAVVMPAALAVSLPPAPTAMPSPVSAPPPFDAPPPHVAPRPAAAKKMSRLAPRAAPATASSSDMRAMLDEHHPALAARRPPPDPSQVQPGDDQTTVRKAHKTMIFALVVLVALAAIGAYLVLTNWNSDDDRDGFDLRRPADAARPIYALNR
jgi:pSer/pThr/pTyr-binding forkhead associated (FHA) protein